MNRFLRGAVLLAVTAALGACGTEPDEFADGTPDHIVAEPSVVFVTRTDSQNVRIRVVDQQGTSLLQPISITDVGAGINVRADSAFRPIFRGDTLVFNPNTTELRVWVSASALDNSSFTITSGDKTLNVPVVVTPAGAEAIPFSSLTPALGDVVTATAGSNLRFTDSTQIVFGADTIAPASIAEDGTSLTFVAIPNLLGPASFTNVTLSYNTNVVFTVAAADTLNTPAVDTFTVTASTTTPAANAPVTITGSTAAFTFDAGTGFTLEGTPALVSSVAGNGTSIDILPPPGVTGQLAVTGGLVVGAPFDLPTNVAMTVGALTPMAGTDAFATAPALNAPAAGATVALWDGGSYDFDASGDFGGGARLYKLTVATTGTYTFSLPYIADGSDLGVYFYDGSQAALGSFVDAGGGGAAESGDVDLDAGTYYIAIVWFDYTPPASLFGLTITGQ
jgi:hypothetical protein